MECFQYGYFDCNNRPPPIQVKHLQNGRIAATAAQKLCLFKLFPIIFYDVVGRLPSFITYKVLREILDLVLSYPFRRKWLPVLGELCDTFHHAMLTHFRDKLLPKVHFVREYEQVTHDYGPPIKQWCFRYEASHAYFKKLTMRTNNFKNVPKMLATRHCLKQCFKFASPSWMNSTSYARGMRKIRSSSFCVAIKTILSNHLARVTLDDFFIQSYQLVLDNIEYRRSAVYVTDLRYDTEQPIFIQLVFILKIEEKWWFVVDQLNTISYDEDLFAWQIKSIDNYCIIDPRELKYFYKGLDVYQVNNTSFVSFTARLTSYGWTRNACHAKDSIFVNLLSFFHRVTLLALVQFSFFVRQSLCSVQHSTRIAFLMQRTEWWNRIERQSDMLIISWDDEWYSYVISAVTIFTCELIWESTCLYVFPLRWGRQSTPWLIATDRRPVTRQMLCKHVFIPSALATLRIRIISRESGCGVQCSDSIIRRWTRVVDRVLCAEHLHSLLYLEYDVDGQTLAMMNNVERISMIIPKFKLQLLFLEEREKLLKSNVDCPEQRTISSSNTTTGSPAVQCISVDSQATPSTLKSAAAVDSPLKAIMNNPTCERSDITEDVDELFSRGYVIPPLPQALIKDVEQGILHKFGPHCSNRQILIEAVAFDLIDKYNLLWVLMYKETQEPFSRTMPIHDIVWCGKASDVSLRLAERECNLFGIWARVRH